MKKIDRYKDFSIEELFNFYRATLALKNMHEKAGLVESKKHYEEKSEEYKNEILRRYGCLEQK